MKCNIKKTVRITGKIVQKIFSITCEMKKKLEELRWKTSDIKK